MVISAVRRLIKEKASNASNFLGTKYSHTVNLYELEHLKCVSNLYFWVTYISL